MFTINGSEAYEKLTNAAKEAGASTRYSASEAGAALNYLALAGYDAEKAVETLPKVLDLAAAGGMELATASDLVTDAMSALQMETDDLDVFINQMARTAQKSNTSVQQLGEAILECAGTAASTGQELTTLNTALGVLADNGIKASEGGTHLRNILLSLSAPTDIAAEQLKTLGVSIYDAQGDMRQLDEVVVDLNESLSRLTQEGRTNAIDTIFNKTDLNAVNALLASTSGRFGELSAQIADCAEAATNMAGTMEAGLAGTARSFNSAMEGMQIEAGAIFKDLKQSLMTDATEVIRSFTMDLQKAGGDWGKISEAIGQAISQVIALVGSYLPQIVEMGMLVLKTLGSALMDNLNIMAEAGASVAMTLIGGVVSAIPGFIEASVRIVETLLKTIYANRAQMMEAGIQLARSLAEGLKTYIPRIARAASQFIPIMISAIIRDLPKLAETAGRIGGTVVETVIAYLPAVREAATRIIQSLLNVFTENLPQIIEKGTAVMNALLTGIISHRTQVIETVAQVIEGFMEAIAANLPQIKSAGISLLNSLADGIKGQLPMLLDVAAQAVNALLDILISSLPQIMEVGAKILLTLIEGVGKHLPSLAEKAMEAMGLFLKTLAQMLPQIIQAGAALLNALIAGIISQLPQILDAVMQIVGVLLEAFVSPYCRS